jgi:hypothetical protein
MIMVIFAKEKDGYAKYQHMIVIPQKLALRSSLSFREFSPFPW